MQIIVGTTESNDCQISIEKAAALSVCIEDEQNNPYAQHLRGLIKDFCEREGVSAKVLLRDKGALDFCVLARLKTAVERMGK